MSQKLLDSAKGLVTNSQLKSAKSSEILLKNLSFLTWLNETYKVIQNNIFHLALALNKHRLKTPVLLNTLFGPKFSISQYFDFLSNVTAANLFFCMTHSSWWSLSNGYIYIYIQ